MDGVHLAFVNGLSADDVNQLFILVLVQRAFPALVGARVYVVTKGLALDL